MAQNMELSKFDMQKMQKSIYNVEVVLSKINKTYLKDRDKTGKYKKCPESGRLIEFLDGQKTVVIPPTSIIKSVPSTLTKDEGQLSTSGFTSGENFMKFVETPVNVLGEDVPPAIDSFENSGLIDSVVQNINRSGYFHPTPIQKNTIPIILAGRDIVAYTQTGSGKTAAFLLPIISKLLSEGKPLQRNKPHVLIVSPTYELVIQIEAECRKLPSNSHLKTLLVYGATTSDRQMDKATQNCHLLVATPARLLDFISRNIVSFEDLRFLVLDDAGEMFDKGFLTHIEKLMQHSSLPSPDKRQTLIFSTTFPQEVQRLVGKILNTYLFVVDGIRTDVEQYIFEVSKFEKRKKLMEIIEKETPDGIIVFVETKRNADFLASFFCEKQVSSTSIHGDRYQRQREEALNDFKSGKMKLLFTTPVRGLDIKNVRHVINYDLPKSIDEYIERVGRNGRVGNCGKAISFFDAEEDYGIAADLKKSLCQSGQNVPKFLIDFIASRKHDRQGNNVHKGNTQYYRNAEEVNKNYNSFETEEW